MCDKQQEPCKICTVILRVIFIKLSVYSTCQVNMVLNQSAGLLQSVHHCVSQSVSLSLLYSISLSMGQSVDQSVSQQLLLQSNIASVFQSISPSVLQFLLSMSHPQWFLSVSPSTHKTFIKQINPSYIHGHSLVTGSVSRLTVLSELNSFCLGTQDDFWGIP